MKKSLKRLLSLALVLAMLLAFAVPAMAYSYSAAGATISAKPTGSDPEGERILTISANDAEYTGNPVEATVSGSLPNETGREISYAKADGTKLASAPTEVGSYTASVTATVEVDSNTYEYTAETSFKITAVNLKGKVTIALGDDATQTYTGNEIKPEPVVTITGENTPLVKDTDYTLSWNNNTNAGTATVKVKFQGKYTGTDSATFTIEPADPTKKDFTFDSDTAKVKVKDGITGMGAITMHYYNDAGEEVTGDAAKLPGKTYTVTIDVAAGTNYNAKNGIKNSNWTYTIADKLTPTAADFTFTAKTGKVTVNDGITGMGAVTVHYYNDAGDVVTGDDAKLPGKTYTVKIDVAEGTAYKAATDVTDTTWTYTCPDKATPTAANFTFTAKTGKVTVNDGITGMGTYTITYLDADKKPVEGNTCTEPGTYYVQIDIAEGDSYKAATLTPDAWTFTIEAKGTINYTIYVIGEGQVEASSKHVLNKEVSIETAAKIFKDNNTTTAWSDYTVSSWYDEETHKTKHTATTVTFTQESNTLNLFAFCYDPKNLKVAFTEPDKTYTYTGKEIKPEIKVTYDVGGQSYALAEGEYTISYPTDATNAGEKTVTVSFNGVYEGVAAKTLKYTIGKATLKAVSVVNQTITYYDALPTLDLDDDIVWKGLQNEEKASAVLKGTVSCKSSYKKGSDATTKYSDKTGTTDAKKPYTVTVDLSKLTVNDNYKLDLTAFKNTYDLRVNQKTLYLRYTGLSMSSVSCELYSNATWHAGTKTYTVSKNDLTTVFGNDHVSYGIYNKNTKQVIHGFLTYKNGTYSGSYKLARGYYLFALELNPTNYYVIKTNDMISSSYSNTSAKR